MEKTIQITIASTGFSLTEGAYTKIESYLSRLKAHFQGATGEEIVRDIESRIAEKLLHKRSHVVREDDIDEVIAEIGDIGQFDDEESEDAMPVRSSRKLYRDMDNAWLGGVAAGIAAYFDIDALWVRFLFLTSIFFGGTGIFLYIVLWMLIPEAKNAAQKLEMRGHAVNIEGIARMVHESVESARENGVIQRIFEGLRRVIGGFFRVLGKAASVVLILGSFFALIGAMVFLGVILTNWHAPYNDFPLRGIVSEPLLFTGLAAGTIAVFIPLVAIFALGIRLWNRRTIFPSAIAFGLIGIWALAVSAVGTITIKSLGEYAEYTRTAPEHQTVTEIVETKVFESVRLENLHATIRSGPTHSVELSGRALDMDSAVVEVEDGVLIVREERRDGSCFFCSHRPPEVIITTPDLASLTLSGARVTMEEYADDALSIEMEYGSLRGAMILDAAELRMRSSNARIELDASSIALDAENSDIDIEGATDAATFTIEHSSLTGGDLLATQMTVTTEQSHGEVNAATLTINDDPESYITNRAAVPRD